MNGRAYIFRRKSGAPIPVGNTGYLGHVAWGFQVGDDDFYFGATENPRGAAQIDAPGDNGWWARRGTFAQMVAAMLETRSHPPYDDYKEFGVASCRPEAAIQMADTKRTAGYTVAGPMGNNCANHVWDILKAYGKELPLLQFDWFPNDWFTHLPGDPLPLAASAAPEKPSKERPSGAPQALTRGATVEGTLAPGGSARYGLPLAPDEEIEIVLYARHMDDSTWPVRLTFAV